MTVLKPYPEYKDSGVPWLGRVPRHWRLVKTKYLFRERSEKGHPAEPLLACTQSRGVIRKERYGSRTVTAQKDLHLLKLACVGDFVISLRAFEGGIEPVHDRGIISPAYNILVPRGGLDAGFLGALFKSAAFVSGLSLFVTGIREGQNIDYERLSRTELPVPGTDEQRSIGRFLRWLSASTSRLIRAKRRMIELLDEQKQAIIQHAVTRGLDPTVPLKPSGIFWLPDIPAHWQVRAIKREFRCLNSRRIPLNGSQRGAMTRREYDYYGASGIIDKVEDFLFDEELLLIAEDGANLVLRNLPLAIVARGQYWVNNHAHVLRPRHGSIEYFAHLLEGIDYLPWITGAAQPKLTADRLLNILIPVPPVAEQVNIACAAAEGTRDLQAMIEQARREIDLIREYRTRLVADVVTGKLDVRHVAVPDVDEAALEDPEAPEEEPDAEEPDEGEEATA